VTDRDPPTPRLSEGRRLEALRRLDVIGTPPEAALDDLVHLISQTTGAAAASFNLVAQDTAWTKATTAAAGQVQVPRPGSLADRAVGSLDGRAVAVVVEDGPGADHPVFAEVALPATCAANVVRAPDGEVVGCLEVAWPGEQVVDARTWGLLARFADHVARVLELRAEVSEYRRFIELSPDPVTVVDLDGAIELANPALATMLGFPTAQSLIGRTFLELVSRRDRARVTAELARVLFARRRTVQLDLHLVGRTGTDIPCSVSAGHLRGSRRHLQLVVHDLSDRLRGEEERSRLSEQLARAQRLDAVGQVAGGLAHDLNNLLVVMVSNLSLAEESLAAAEGGGGELTPVREDLSELSVAVDRAVELTSKLLQFARREDGQEGLADVAAAIETVRTLFVGTLGTEVALEIDVAADLPQVAADTVQLERALLNLLLNARDAIERDGTISVSARPVPAATGRGPTPHAEGRWAPGRTGVRITVADDGCGMDEATQARIFEPLFTTKAARGGSGLGLAVVLALADDTDGSVTVRSAVGRGTEVDLLLPAADPAEAEVPVGVDVPVAGARVLLADPGERTRRVIARMLKAAGYRVTTVATGEDALAHIEDHGTDLLITELALPGITGDRLVEQVGAIPDGPGIVALASVDAPPTLDGLPILVKPFSHTRLLRTVERVTRRD
jgi:two-component system, cell cycle sensor histidine kinase and response regulator CckA